jgi:hypothetical protein
MTPDGQCLELLAEAPLRRKRMIRRLSRQLQLFRPPSLTKLGSRDSYGGNAELVALPKLCDIYLTRIVVNPKCSITHLVVTSNTISVTIHVIYNFLAMMTISYVVDSFDGSWVFRCCRICSPAFNEHTF